MKVVTDEERCLEAQSLDRGISYTTSNSDAVSENKPVETFEKLLQLKQDLMNDIDPQKWRPPASKVEQPRVAKLSTPAHKKLHYTPPQEALGRQFQMNTTSKQILKRTGLDQPFFNRSAHLQAKSERQLAKLKHQLLARDDSQSSPSPEINPKSRRLHRSVDDMMEWQVAKNHKLELERQRQERELEAKLQDKVSKFVHSKKGTGTTVEDRLKAWSERYAERKRQARENELRRFSFQPQLDEHSANLKRSGSISDRLYGLALAKAKSKDVVSRPEEEEVTQSSFTPEINPVSKNLTFHAPVTDRLLAKGREYRENQAKARDAEAAEAQKLQNQSKLSYTSEKLAQRRKKLGHKTKKGHFQEEGAIATKEHRISSRHANELYDRLVVWKSKTECKIEFLKQQQEAKIKEECDQHCKPTTKSILMSERMNREEDVEPQELNRYLYERGQNQRLEKQKWIQHQRQLKVLEESSSCTFQPRINPPLRATSIHQGSFGEQEEEEEGVCLSALASMLKYSKSLSSPSSSSSSRSASTTSEWKSNHGAVIISAAQDGQVLPLGWEEYVNDEGYLYYYNIATHATQWEFPSANPAD